MSKKIETKEPYIEYDICSSDNKFEVREKVAAFDYDHTLVKPKSGVTFSKNVNDWVWLRDNVPNVLKKLYYDGYSILVFTNQSKQFKLNQIRNVLEELDLPIRVFIGISKTAQKPNTFMWNKFLEKCENVEIKGMYVGDALGRVGDWSDSDKIFGELCGLEIVCPEKMFPFNERISKSLTLSEEQELIMMMGYPGSGKTTYALEKIPDSYTKLHGDILKTDAKKKKALKLALENGESVVLDATHPSIEKRKAFVNIAKEFNVPVRLVHVTTSFDESKSRNANRETKLPPIVLYVYRKKYEEPSISEGFSEIINI